MSVDWPDALNSFSRVANDIHKLYNILKPTINDHIYTDSFPLKLNLA